MAKSKSFLKWAGGKFGILDTILSFLPKADRLIEPFTGSATIFINSSFENYLLAEHNPDLVNLFLFIQQEGLSFIVYCQKLFKQEFNTKEQYYFLRAKFNACKFKRQRAALFLYLNRHGYNGLCRYNSSGGYNVPFGRYKKVYFPDAEMLKFHQKSQGVTILLSDFRKTFTFAKSSDVIYCDPPYTPLSETASFASYTRSGFSETDHLALAKLAQETAKLGIPVLISNHDTPLTREYYKNAEIFSFSVNRYISCQSNRRLPVKELIAVFK